MPNPTLIGTRMLNVFFKIKYSDRLNRSVSKFLSTFFLFRGSMILLDIIYLTVIPWRSRNALLLSRSFLFSRLQLHHYNNEKYYYRDAI